jgi:hypothetical protein
MNFMIKRSLIVIFLVFLLKGIAASQQNPGEISHELFFISDCQLPLGIEEILLSPYKNKEGRDSLFADMTRRKPGNIFLLGDLVSIGSKKNKWTDIDQFIHSFNPGSCNFYAIPGNHEYLFSPGKGIANYLKRFPVQSQYGYCVRKDSVAIVMLNSNLDHLSGSQEEKQLNWYASIMDSLEQDASTQIIIVCTHHSPYSNSKVVGSSEIVQNKFVPEFRRSSKAKLFISGHSHDLEYFKISNKYFLVIGGGGGLAHPLLTGKKQQYEDLINRDEIPLFFYLTVERQGRVLDLKARGIKREFDSFSTYNIGQIEF